MPEGSRKIRYIVDEWCVGVIPMFIRPYLSQSLYYPLYDISPYVSHIPQSLYPPLLFHRSVFHSLYSPNIFPSPYVPKCLCSPNMFPSHYVPPTSSPVPMFPSPIPQNCFHSLCSLNMFPSACVPQSLCSSKFIFSNMAIHAMSIFLIVKKLFMQQCIRLCIFMKIGEDHFWIWSGTHLGRVVHISSTRIVIIASPKTRIGEHRDWWTGWGDVGTGEHRDWGTCLGNIGTGKHLIAPCTGLLILVWRCLFPYLL